MECDLIHSLRVGPFDFYCIATDFAFIGFVWIGRYDARNYDSAWLDSPAADGNVCNSNVMAYKTCLKHRCAPSILMRSR